MGGERSWAGAGVRQAAAKDRSAGSSTGIGKKRALPPRQQTATHERATHEQTSPLEQERDDLKIALEAALARIRALEGAQAQVANRIGWMIEALQTLRDEGR